MDLISYVIVSHHNHIIFSRNHECFIDEMRPWLFILLNEETDWEAKEDGVKEKPIALLRIRI